MQDTWRVGKHRGKFAAVTGSGPSRRRIKLDAIDKAGAEGAVRQLNIETNRLSLPATLTISQIYGLYEAERKRRGTINMARIREVARTLEPIWGSLTPDDITPREVERFTELRRDRGCSDNTIRSDLAYITAALNFAFKAKLIPAAPYIEKPPNGRPRERWLDRTELESLIDNAIMLHVKLFIILAVTTAGRPKHILDLTWDRVDLNRRVIDLDNPSRDRTRKGRARVPINDTGLEHLQVAYRARSIANVIEVDGHPIKSIRNGVKAAARRAGLVGVSQYVLRHTAGVYMAQAGVPMAEIAEYMGHSSIATTIRHYARFGPDHLRKAAGALEIIRRTSGSTVPATVNYAASKSE